MLDTVLTSIISFISTNIDDLFVLMFLYLQVDHKRAKLSILSGRYIGVAVILAISFLGSFGASFLPQKYLGLLGIIPIILGIKEWLKYKHSKKSDENGKNNDSELLNKSRRSILFSTVLLTVSNGADNIGVYVPLLAGFSTADVCVFISIFAFMTALWCFFSVKLVNFPKIKEKLQRYGHILVPIIFIVLGVYIIAKNYI